MRFDELNADNYIMFAIKHYENPQSVTKEDFEEDLKRFKYLKRLLRKYLKSGELRTHLILNHIIILFNVFGDATIPLMMYKLEMEYWSALKTFLVYLDLYPEFNDGSLHEVDIDMEIYNELGKV
jgi:hypothetical protein